MPLSADQVHEHNALRAPVSGSRRATFFALHSGVWRSQLWTTIALAMLTYFAFSQLSKWPGRLRYPGEEDAAEGTQLSEMVHLKHGVQIYRVPSGGEFDSAIYGPLSYLLGSAVISPDQPAYLPLRLLSLFATLGLLALAAIFAFKLTGAKLASVLAVLLLLSTAYIGRYGVSARADMMSLFLAFSGFLLFYCYSHSNRALAAAALLLTLALFYKQQFVGAPVSIFIFLAVTRQLRKLVLFSCIIAITSLTLVAIFSFLIFPHQAFLQHFVSYNHLWFDKALLVPEILMFVIPLFVPLLGSADFLDQHANKLVLIYVCTSCISYFLLLSSSGSGADTNRCLEPLFVLSCVFAARLATMKGMVSGFAWTAALALTLGVVSILRAAFVVPQIEPSDFVADARVQEYLRDAFPARTPALGYYAGDPIRAGLEAPVTNLWHYSALIRKGQLSDRDLLSQINSGGYGVILLDFDLTSADSNTNADFYTTASMREAILKTCTLAAKLALPPPEFTRYTDGKLYVWVPRQVPASRPMN